MLVGAEREKAIRQVRNEGIGRVRLELEMISFLNGILAARSTQAAFIEVAGVGYEVFMSQASLSKLPEINCPVRVLTYLQISDNGIALFGFLSEEEKAVFEDLITVSGVGPKVALAALSTFSPKALVDAVAAQDIDLVARIPGVGKKTASRIVLELKETLGQVFVGSGDYEDAGTSTGAKAQSKGIQGAREALLSMGFTPTEAELALKDAPVDESEAALLQYALKRLGS